MRCRCSPTAARCGERRPSRCRSPTGPSAIRLLDALAALAFTDSTPTGFDADTVLRLDGRRSDRLDLRLSAIIPIAAIARWAAAVAGSEEVSTPDRLRAAAADGVLAEAQASTLSEAFELALELRIVHQLEQLASGERPDDLRRPGGAEPADPQLSA